MCDPFGRLRKINDTSDQSLVAEYWYNGLNFRITVHEDTDTDVDVDVDVKDEKHHLIYDARGQMVALFVDDSDTPQGMGRGFRVELPAELFMIAGCEGFN